MKKILIFLMVLFLMIGGSQIVLGANSCTITEPATNDAISGTVLMTVTMTIGDDGTNITNMTLSSTSDGIFATNKTTVAGTANYTTWNFDVDTSSALTEIASTTITATGYDNHTGGITANFTCTSTGVAIDNTNPTCSSLTVDKDIIEVLTPIEVAVSASDTTTLFYTCSFAGADGTTTVKNQTSSIVNFDGAETGDLGFATMACNVTDIVTQSTACTSITDIWVQSEGATTPPPDSPDAQAEAKEKNTLGLMLLLFVVVIIVVMLFIMKGIKKKNG